jgi:D-lactate dehydrogenase
MHRINHYAWRHSARFHSTKSANTTIIAKGVSHRAAAALTITSLTAGYLVGTYQSSSSPEEHQQHERVLPNGLPRTCCQENERKSTLSHEQEKELVQQLRKIVGEDHLVIDGSLLNSKTQAYLKGARLGGAPCLCIVTPEHLHHVVSIVKAVVDAGAVIVPQGANTGLTGGSVPRYSTDSRPIVVLSLKKLNSIFPLDDGKRVCCLAGAGLAQLQLFLQQYFPDRETHSTLGSTFLNPTAAAGVALGSGGTQCRKGPAYTERALYLKVTQNKWKENVVEIVNTLDIEGLEDDPNPRSRLVMDSVPYRVDTWSRWIQEGYAQNFRYSTPNARPARDVHYKERLCAHDENDKQQKQASRISRYNADTSGPEFVRSEGKVILLATVHDTFPKPKQTKTLWLSFDQLETALQFRKQVCLNNPNDVPISCEYLDRDSFDIIDRSGRFLGKMIAFLGTSSPIVSRLWNVKLAIEGAGFPFLVDQWLHFINNAVPPLLPSPIQKLGHKWDHHVVVTVGDFDDTDHDDNSEASNTDRNQNSLTRFEQRLQNFLAQHPSKVETYECSPSQVPALTAFRFVAAPAFRTWCVGEGVQGYSVDYALPVSGGLAPPIDQPQPLRRMRYSHFACNVVHEDLAYARDVDLDAAKYAFKHIVEHDCGGRLPAEHGHGTEYKAPPETQRKWQYLDPLNVLNPGVGQTSEHFQYKTE